MMPDFEHNGVTIELTSGGRFAATVRGKFTIRPSLAAMKKYIDNLDKTAFEEFTGIVPSSWQTDKKTKIAGTDYHRVKVVGIVKSKRRYSGKQVSFEVAAGLSITESVVYKDCAATIDTIKKLEAHRKKVKKVRDELEKEDDRLEKELAAFRIDPDSFVAGKGK